MAVWTVPEAVAGVDDWPKRWREKAGILETVDWANFRRNYQLMEGMQDPPEKLEMWLARARSLGFNDELLHDPCAGNPVGTMLPAGGFVTTPSVRFGYYAQQILMRAGRLEGAHHLEIGGGFGGLAFSLHRAHGTKRVTLLDAPPCIELQTRYLRDTAPGLEVVPYDEGLTFDIVTNSHSFGEMTREEVLRYFGVIQSQVDDGGYFFTANRVRRIVHLEDYPYDGKWEHDIWLTAGTEKGVQFFECLSRRNTLRKSPHPSALLAA